MSQPMPAFEKRKTSDVLIPGMGAPAGAARFEQFQCQANQFVLSLPPEQQLILCVLLYEGVTNYQGLLGCLNASDSRFRIAEDHYVSWMGSEVGLGTRSLDARTTIAASRVSEAIDWQRELICFRSFLIAHYPSSLHCLARDMWDMVFHDSTSWLYLVGPDLFRCKPRPDANLTC